LASLGPEQVWLDAGAGYARAQREFRALGGQATLVAAGFRKPHCDGTPGDASQKLDAELAAFEAQDPRFRYVEGPLQHGSVQAKIGQVDVLTDMIGFFSYRHVAQVARTMALLLKPGGTAYLLIPARSAQVSTWIGGTPRPIADWFTSLGAFEVVRRTRVTPFCRSPHEVLVLRRTDAPAPELPLYLTSHNVDSMPPGRIYSELPERQPA
jgi:hypothetical protein